MNPLQLTDVLTAISHPTRRAIIGNLANGPARFLDIAKLLKLDVSVVRDNDGQPKSEKAKFTEYEDAPNIHIHIDADAAARTLEPQLVKANGRENLNTMLGKHFATEQELSAYMTANKTDCALALYEHADTLAIPAYISDAIR